MVFFRFTAVFVLDGEEAALARTTVFFVFEDDEDENFFFTATDFLRKDALEVVFFRDF